MAHVISSIVHGVQQIKKKAKQNYKYMRMGMREEAKGNKRKRVESNIRGVMQANPEMGNRMQAEYKKLKKQGKY